MIEAKSPDSLKIRTALNRIGLVLQAEMKYHAKRQQIIDTGSLLNSIRYEVTQSGDTSFLTVGSFGIKYAAMNEFGGKMSRSQVQKMFSEIRIRKGYSKVPRTGKGIVTVYKDGTGYWRPRPFIFRALKDKKNFIIQVMRELNAAK
jgi:phage gpG-like protein